MTQRKLAEAIGVPYQRIREIVNGRLGITPSTAFRLSRYFGTSSGFWMTGQMRWDLYHAQQSEGDESAGFAVIPVLCQDEKPPLRRENIRR